MSILLINPLDYISGIRYPVNRPPYDMLYLESYLQHKGVMVFYLDIENEKITKDEFRRRINEINADYYVINTTGKSYHFQNFLKTPGLIKEIITEIKKNNPKSFIMLSGETSNIYTEMYLQLEINCILFDEPEYGVLEIVKTQAKSPVDLKNIKGIYYKSQGIFFKNPPRNTMKTLDELPPPRWEKLGGYLWDSAYRERKEFIDIIGARGCPHNCKFCKSSLSDKVLCHSPEYLLKQIKVLNKEFGYTDFFIRDYGYFEDSSRCQDLCSGLKDIKGIIWKCNSRINSMNEAKLRLMKESGCSLISYGIESGNDRTLKIVNKGITVKESLQTVLMTKRQGIKTAAYFILDFPCENLRDKLKTFIFAKKINADILYINQYYPLKMPAYKNVIKKLKEKFNLSFNALLTILFFWRRESITYYHQLRVDRLGYNFKHYLVARKKLRW
ncbi:MAG: radical SAM protein [Candidatus Omnitrophota bacterium]|jgi:radical SAM superfamily enzyme YgiQ (UPF0313 family)